MKSNTAKNYGSVLLYQFVTIGTPLLTTPYTSRILGPKAIGLDAYLYSFVQLFMLIVLLGLPMYASKKIAQAKSYSESNKLFSELFSFQLMLTILTTILYVFFIVFFSRYQLLLCLYLITIISTGIDTSWYFVGKEKISMIMVRNILVRLVTVACIFLLVKTSLDLWKYLFISGASLLVGQLVTCRMVLKEIENFQLTLSFVKKHSIPVMVLFIIPFMSVLSLSTSKILLEIWSGQVEVGMFSQAYKLYIIVISFITAINSVFLPKIAREFVNNNHEEIKRYLHFSIRLIAVVSIPLSVGILLTSQTFIPLFLGKEFKEVSLILDVISLSFVFKGLKDIFGIQYLIATNRNKEYAISTIIETVITIVTCYLFLKIGLQALSPAIALLIGTISGLITELFYSRKGYSIKFLFSVLGKYILLSLIMGFCIQLSSLHIRGGEGTLLVVQLSIGILSYIILLIVSKDSAIKLLSRKKLEI